MITTVFAIVCGLVILWAIEMRLSDLGKKYDELQVDVLKIKTALEEIKAKLK